MRSNRLSQVYKSRGGTQHHLCDVHGITWCGLTPNRLRRPTPITVMQIGEDGIYEPTGEIIPAYKVWEDVPEYLRCKACELYRPRVIPFHRVVRGVVLPARTVRFRRREPLYGARGRRESLYHGTKLRPYSDGWGGAYGPRPPESNPSSGSPP